MDTIREFTAESRGHATTALIGSNAAGAVHSVFTRAINIRTAEQGLFALLDTDVGNAPNAFVIPGGAAMLVSGIKPGMAVEFAGGCLSVPACGVTFRLGRAKLWMGEVPANLRPENLPAKVATLRTLLAAARPQEGLGALPGMPFTAVAPSPLLALAGPRLCGLLRAVNNRDIRESVRHGVKLLGLGPGLTPSGDDVLAGLMATLYWGGCAGLIDLPFIREVNGGICATARKQTNLISATMLDYAARGEVPERMHDLLAAVFSGTSARITQTAPRVLAVGGASGADWVLGILLAAELLANRLSGVTWLSAICENTGVCYWRPGGELT